MFFREHNREMNKAEVAYILTKANVAVRYLAGLLSGRKYFPESTEYMMYSMDDHEYNNRASISDIEQLHGTFVPVEPVCENTFVNSICTRTGIPRWINLSVYDTTADTTQVVANISSDQVSDISQALHEWEGHPPFHCLTAPIPPSFEIGQDNINLPTNFWRTEGTFSANENIKGRWKSSETKNVEFHFLYNGTIHRDERGVDFSSTARYKIEGQSLMIYHGEGIFESDFNWRKAYREGTKKTAFEIKENKLTAKDSWELKDGVWKPRGIAKNRPVILYCLDG